MNRGPSEHPDYEAKYYVVCVIDLLGQTEKLSGWKELPSDGKATRQFITAIKQTCGTILWFKEHFHAYFLDTQQHASAAPFWNQLDAGQQAKFERFKTCSLSTQQFSDTFVFYSPIVTTHKDCSPLPIYQMLIACTWATILSLAARIPLRGGMCIGTGLEFETNNFYGPALATAHHLESKVAEYPRIVVSEEIIQFISQGSVYSDDANINSMMQSIADLCRSFICIDTDQRSIVDTFGKSVRDLSSDSPDENLHGAVTSAYQFTCDELQNFLQSGNSKLMGRYTLLKRYIEARLPLWNVKSGKANNGE